MSISCETETRNLTEQNILIALNNTHSRSRSGHIHKHLAFRATSVPRKLFWKEREGWGLRSVQGQDNSGLVQLSGA